MIDLEKQSRELEGRTDGARINTMNKSDELFKYFWPDVKTLHQSFLKGKEKSENADCYGYKPSNDSPFKWISYAQVYEYAKQVGSGMNKLGYEPAASDLNIGIFAKNRVEWSLVEQACYAYSYCSVPLYETLGEEAISFILEQTKMKIVFCDDSNKASSIMNRKSSIKHIVIFDEITSEAREMAKEKNIEILSFDDLKKLGKDNLIKTVPADPESWATICYTSGTTGMPKGAIITHTNMITVISTIVLYMHKSNISKLDSQEQEQERYLSYLPLAHILEREVQLVMLSIGGKIGFFQGDVKTLLDDVKSLSPTIFVTVPRLMNRIFSVVKDTVEGSSPIKQKIFNWAFKNKEREIESGNFGPTKYDFAFKNVKAKLGGNVKLMITGSAPISPEVLSFMRVVSGAYVYEGYGATETCGGCNIGIIGDTSIGNVGPPMLGALVKLIDVPSMGLVASRDNRGEVCIAGPSVFKGYYKDEEKTKAVLIDGWYHSGDIGVFEKNGTLKIVDRVKNIFKLQQGEYVAPEKIENVYIKSKYIAQAFVYGDSLKSSLVGVIVPEEEKIMEWAKGKNLEANMDSLCKNTELKELILKDANDLGKKEGLKGFEQIRKVHLHNKLFTLEEGLLTPTMKAKRNELKQYFIDEITEMYTNLD